MDPKIEFWLGWTWLAASGLALVLAVLPLAGLGVAGLGVAGLGLAGLGLAGSILAGLTPAGSGRFPPGWLWQMLSALLKPLGEQKGQKMQIRTPRSKFNAVTKRRKNPDTARKRQNPHFS